MPERIAALQLLLRPIGELRPTFAVKGAQSDGQILNWLGSVLWDVFSNNHTVTDSNGTECVFGSFRGSADVIAEELSAHYATAGVQYDYLDFYMGTIGFNGREELIAAYKWVFGHLIAHCHNWRYSFPRLRLITLTADVDGDFLKYDPSTALATEFEKERERKEMNELEDRLAEEHHLAVLHALESPPPPIVDAYRQVYGRWPDGWPPVFES